MRIWEVRHNVMNALPFMPEPDEIVLEMQDSPLYHLEGRGRPLNSSQIVTTISGEGCFRKGNEIFRLTPGRTFCSVLGNPDTAYYYPGYGTQEWIFLWISFYGECAVRMTDCINEKYGFVFDLPLDRGFIPHLESAKSMSGSCQILTPFAGAKIVHDALAALSETIEHNEALPKGRLLARNAQEMIAANLDRELDLAGIAGKLHVTREHLSRVFHAETGMTPAAFAFSERMRTAKRLLNANLLSCKEIASRLGYESASSFTRAFRQSEGMSPREFQKTEKESSLP